MKIKDLLKMSVEKDGECIEFDALLVEKKTLTKNNGDPYLQVIMQDNTGKIEFPIWTDFSTMSELLEEKSVYNIKGILIHWNDTVQIKNPKIMLIDTSNNIDMSLYVPTYDIPQELYDYFLNTVKNLNYPYNVIAKAATGCDGYNKKRWKEFTTCVSAEKHHGNKRGGLFLHTVGLMKEVEAICERYINNPYFYNAKDVINYDRLMLKAILHDIKKIDEYEYDGVIRYKPGKKTNHLVNGVVYLRQINMECGEILSEEDVEDIAYSILSHHGQWGPYQPKSLEDTLLHLADMVDSQIVGAIEKNVK
ncbi:MAG: HD domain-containing protein [Clostridia bacterium]|nr:HD domain-containing protein [Clostridia bacterium]